MNCQDISRIADTGRIAALKAAEREAVEAHVRGCGRCAAVWSAHERLLALDSPSLPAEVTLRFHALAAASHRSQGRYAPRRLIVIGSLAVLAAAAGALIWGLVRPPSPASLPAAAGTAAAPADDAGSSGFLTPAARPAAGSSPASTAASGDEAALCEQTIRELEAFAVTERDAVHPDRGAELAARERSDEQVQAEVRGLQRRLAGSRDPHVFLTAMLLAPPERRVTEDPAARAMLVELGSRAAEAGVPLLAWHALRACVAADQSCPYASVLQGLVEANRQNAEAWALLALFKSRRGDSPGALAAMQEAARAPDSTWYWAESVDVIERTLAAGTAMSDLERMNYAFGSTAAALPPAQVSTLCRAESARSRAWAEACLDFAALRSARGDTTAAQLQAYSFREQALQELGDMEGAAQVAQEYALYEAQRIGGALAPVGNLQTVLIESDPARLRSFIGAMQQHGEGAGARRFLRQQLPPLMARAGLLEREGARECVAGLFEPRTALGTPATTVARQLRVGDELLVSVRNPTLSTVVQVWPDGRFAMPLSVAVGRSTRVPQSQVVAVGKTPGQLQEEIAMLFARRGQLPKVFVIPLTPRSRVELRREFDIALQESAQARN